ncbi:MAG TPA: hypothetical protein VJ417_13035 [Candidatus Glassbacteria bacterium]|nr:hypothetical protein [Candidatus Glassbacteria bacterium]
MGLLSAGCLFWLERLQPVFFTVAIGSLIYQVLIYRRRPPFLRSWGVKAILATSVVITVAVIGTWIALWLRYR